MKTKDRYSYSSRAAWHLGYARALGGTGVRRDNALFKHERGSAASGYRTGQAVVRREGGQVSQSKKARSNSRRKSKSGISDSKKRQRNFDREGSALIPYGEDNPFTEAMLDFVEQNQTKKRSKKK